MIDVTGSIVMPGLVDTHRHTWQSLLRYAGADWSIPQYGEHMFGRFGPRFTPEDMYLGIRLGLAEALDAGITQVLDWNHNLLTREHVEQSLRAHRESGMRIVFGYGENSEAWLSTYDPDSGIDGARSYPDGVRRVRDELGDGGLVTLAIAPRGPEKSPMEVVAAHWALARDLGVRISVHVGNGPNGRQRAVAKLEDAGLLGGDTTYIHCNTLADDELRMIAGSGGSASVAPVVEANMGHGPLALGRLLAVGVRPGLSVDTCVNAAGDLFGALRGAVAITRAQAHEAALEHGEWVDSIALPVREALLLATRDGAAANGLPATGTLAPGQRADVVVLSTDRPNLVPATSPVGAIVMGAHPGNVDSVWVDGRALKRNGELLMPDYGELRSAVARRSAELLGG